MTNIKYLIDTNVLVQAKNLYYKFHFCPGFWDWIVKLNPDGILSIKNVYDEFLVTDDELKQWIIKRKKSFVDFDNNALLNMKIIKQLLDKKNIPPYQQKEFLNVADSYLVAYAMAYNCVIITHEKLPTNDLMIAKGKIQLPSVAKELGVTCKTIYEVMEEDTEHKLILAK